MSFGHAWQKFAEAEAQADSHAIALLAEGLQSLARAIESDLNEIKNDVRRVQSRVESMR